MYKGLIRAYNAWKATGYKNNDRKYDLWTYMKHKTVYKMPDGVFIYPDDGYVSVARDFIEVIE